MTCIRASSSVRFPRFLNYICCSLEWFFSASSSSSSSSYFNRLSWHGYTFPSPFVSVCVCCSYIPIMFFLSFFNIFLSVTRALYKEGTLTKLEILFISFFVCVLCVFALRFFSFFLLDALLWMWVWFAVFFLLLLFISCFTLNILHTKRVVLVAFISLLEHFLIVRNRYDRVLRVWSHTGNTYTYTHTLTLTHTVEEEVDDGAWFCLFYYYF